MPDMNDLLRSGGDEAVRDHLARAERFVPDRSSKADEARANGGEPDARTREADGKPDLRWPGIHTSPQFLASFVPPDPLIAGILNRGYFYSMTGSTGSGKTGLCLLITSYVALNRPRLAGREISGGAVLYLSGENPVDVMLRWDAMSKEVDFDPAAIDAHFVPGTFDIKALMPPLHAWAEKLGGRLALVILDTSVAFFSGSEENDNVQLGSHARMLRGLTRLRGNPCVIAACHPTKAATNDNLIPRGGGAFLNEVDANLSCTRDDNVIRLHWQGKIRGSDFDPVSFELAPTACPTLKDSMGRELKTVVVRPLSALDEQRHDDSARGDEDHLLLAMLNNPRATVAVLRAELGWPHNSRVSRTMSRLAHDRFVELRRGHWQLTKLGKTEARRAETPL